jgi:hypothetical protein
MRYRQGRAGNETRSFLLRIGRTEMLRS